GKLSAGIAAVGGVTVPMAAAIDNRVQVFIKCANDVGAGSITGYTSKSNGADFAVLAIGEDDASKIFKCIVKTGTQLFSIAGPTTYGVYGAAYSVKNTDTGRSFYLTFVASNDKTASALCGKIPNCDNSKLFTVAVYTAE
ncbi:MAG: hypothetical protein WC652_06930, partial [archaeon]